MPGEGAESFLLRQLKFFNLKPLTDRSSLGAHRRRIAEAGAGGGEIVLEFLACFAKHVANCMPFRLRSHSIYRKIAD